MSRYRSAAVALLFVVVTVAMTWPQAWYLGSRVYDADDPLLSIWRISWVAHILPITPSELFNGNIFYPEKRTLAYTDSVLLQGLAGAPLIWAGVSPTATYNLLLLASIALSGWAMWRYAYHLTGSSSAALLAGIVFAYVPYRFDHYHHLELQGTVFLPLTLLYFDRFIESRARRDAWLMMLSFVAQVYSCIYYSVFLATALLPIAGWRIVALDASGRAAVARRLLPAVIVAVLLTIPYLMPYVENRQTLGERLDRDVHLYSATLPNYLATPEFNAVHGEWSRAFGAPERLLFAGVIALAIAAIGLSRIDQRRISLLIAGATGFVISFGLNTPLYEPLRALLFPYRGLRAPARASILVFLAIAALVAYGWKHLLRRRSPRTRMAATMLAALALLAEYETHMVAWLTVPTQPPAVYRWLAAQPRSVVAEVPFARADSLHSIADGLYMFNSTWHWQPIVNGYSGFFPPTFYELAEQAQDFPDDRSIAYLKARGVDVIVLHGRLLGPDAFGRMTAALVARPDIQALARFEEQMGSDAVFRLIR